MLKVLHGLFRLLPALVLGAICPEGEALAAGVAPTIRVRIEWSADAPVAWVGHLAVSGGELAEPQSLGFGKDDAGTIAIEEGGLSLRRRSARANDAFEVSVTAPPDVRLDFEIRDQNSQVPLQAMHFALADCFHKPQIQAGDGNRPRIVVRRAPGDVLPVHFDRPHLVFDPEESLRISVVLNLLEARDDSDKPVRALLKWKLVPAGANRPVAEGSTTVSAVVNSSAPADVPLELRMPRDEGVYNLKLAATGLGFTDVERVVQLVVVDLSRNSGSARAGGEEKLVDSFEPATAGMFRKVSLHTIRQKTDPTRSRFPKVMRLGDEPHDNSDARPEGNVLAYKLHVSHPGLPHRLEISCPEMEQNPIVALWQIDEKGQFVPCGPDGVISNPPGRFGAATDAAGEVSTFRQIFWPQNRECVVTVSNRRPVRPSDFSSVKVYECGELLPAETVRGSTATVGGPPGPRQRLVGRYLSKPFLAASFGAPQSYFAAERFGIDDWQTFLLAGRRLVEFLPFEQQAALLLAVHADGAAIYPSQFVGSSLQYDTGRLASSGQDPIQKDVLELIFRLFDRSGLALIPEFQFDAPLLDLERWLRGEGESAEDVLLVDREGRTRGELGGGMRGASAGYNVLSPRVQRAVLAAVEELLERYQQHPSLAGVAFELSPDSVLQLPGIDWGYDRETVRRFEEVMRTRIVPGDGKNWRLTAYQHLTTTARREWLRFRCAEVARFHRRLADLVNRKCPDARVIFSGHLGPVGDSDSEAEILEAVRGGQDPAQLLLQQGLDFSQPAYLSAHNVTVLRPSLQNLTADSLSQAALTTLNNSPVIDALYRGGSRGGMLFSVNGGGQRWRNETDDSRAGALSERIPPTVANAVPTIRRYERLVATLDAQVLFDGGATMSLTPDDGTLRLRRTLSQLPDLPFQLAGPQVQPLVVRAARSGRTTFLYAVNDSALRMTGELILDCPRGTTCRTVDTLKAVPLQPLAGGQQYRLPIALEAYELYGVRFDQGGVEVLATRLTMSDGLLADVHQRIDSLSARMSAVTSLARAGSRSLSNPGFEQPGSDERGLPGWELSAQHASWTLDEENPRSGQRSLKLNAAGDRTLLESPELALEGSRFVTMALWMRSSKSAARVRMSFEARIDGEDFRQEAAVEVGKSWKQYSFRVDQLPSGQMRNARLRVQPTDVCRLWIDDVEIDAQSFSNDEVRQLTKTLSSVKLAWEEGRYADCQRLLDGYWGQLLLSEPAPPLLIPARPRLSDRVKSMFRR